MTLRKVYRFGEGDEVGTEGEVADEGDKKKAFFYTRPSKGEPRGLELTSFEDIVLKLREEGCYVQF